LVAREAVVIVAPLVLAIVVVITVSPLVDRLTRAGLAHALSVSLVFLSMLISIGGVALMVGRSMVLISARMDEFKQKFELTLSAIVTRLREMGVDVPKENLTDLASGDAVGGFVEAVLGGFGTFASDLFLFLFVAIFLLIEVPLFARKAAEVEAGSGRSFAAMHALVGDVRHYMGLKTLTSLATAILMMIWLAVLSVPFVPLWGVLTFLLYFIPNIGAAIVATAASIIAFADGGLVTALLAGAGFGVVTTLMNNVVEPRFFGHRMGIAMSIVFISLVVWGWVLGPTGMLLAVPLTMMVKRSLEVSEGTKWLAQLMG
jgi:predicted PurR-regulated permease PerM